MFLVNSRLNLFTAALSGSTGKRFHPTGALLIPKLRSDFAEFLNDGYLDHLSILYLPTCVGLGTGTPCLPRGFSWRHGFRNFAPLRARHPVSGLCSADFPTERPTRLPQDDQRLGFLSLPRPPIGDNDRYVVPEYQPVIHRLRLSASA